MAAFSYGTETHIKGRRDIFAIQDNPDLSREEKKIKIEGVINKYGLDRPTLIEYEDRLREEEERYNVLHEKEDKSILSFLPSALETPPHLVKPTPGDPQIGDLDRRRAIFDIQNNPDLSEEEKQIQTKDVINKYSQAEIWRLDPGKVMGKAIGQVGEAVGTAAEYVLPEAVTTPIKEWASEADRYLEENEYTRPAWEGLQRFVDPVTTIEEDVTSIVAPGLGTAGLTIKALKGAPKAARWLAGGTAMVGTETIMDDFDETSANWILSVWEKSEGDEANRTREMLERLAIDENDTEAEQYLKKAITITLENAVLGGTLWAGIKTIKGSKQGVDKLINTFRKDKKKTKAIDEGITSPVESEGNVVAESVDLIETPTGVMQKTKLNEVLGGINKRGKRFFKEWFVSAGEAGEEVQEMIIKNAGDQKNALLQVEKSGSRLEKAIKKEYGTKYKKVDEKHLTEIDRALGNISPEELNRPEHIALFKRVQTEITKQLKKSNVGKTGSNKLSPEEIESQALDAATNAVKEEERVLHRQLQKQSLDNLPASIRKEVEDMRSQIDYLSDEILELDIPGRESIKATIDANRGIYLNRSYEVYHNPKWAQDILKVVKGKGVPQNAKAIQAVDSFKKYLKKSNPKLTENEINLTIQELMERVWDDGVLDPSDLMSLINQTVSKPTANILEKGKILGRKKVLAKPFRDLLGETKDPLKNYERTALKMQGLIAERKFLNEIKTYAERNYGTDLFGEAGERTLENSAHIGKWADARLNKYGSADNPLNKLFSTPEFKQALDDGIQQISGSNMEMSGFGRTWMKGMAAAQVSKTIGNNITHLRNLTGNAFIMLANGNLGLKSGREVIESAKVLWNKSIKDNQAFLDEYKKLQRLGVVDSGVNAAQFKRVLKDASRQRAGDEGIIFARLKKAGKWTANIYQAEDDLWKIAAFNRERDKYLNALGRDFFEDEAARLGKTNPANTSAKNIQAVEDVIDDYAAQVVRRTMPNYNVTPRVVKELRRLPIGNFAAFPAEILRTSKNVVIQAKNDIMLGMKTGNKELRNIGLKRLGGLTGAMLGVEAAVETSASMFGITRDDQDAFKAGLSPYQRNSPIYYLSPITLKKNGKLEGDYIDFGMTDPYQSIKAPLRSIYAALMSNHPISDGEITEQFQQAAVTFFTPYFGESLAVEAAINLYRDPTLDETVAFAKTFIPGAALNINRMMEAYQSETKGGGGVDKYGFPLNFKSEVTANLTGIRPQTLNFTQSVPYSIREKQNKIKNAQKEFNKVVNDQNIAAHPEELIESYQKVLKDKYDTTKLLATQINKLQNLTYIDEKTGHRHKMTEAYLNNLLTGGHKYKLDKNIYSLLTKEGGTFFAPTFSWEQYHSLLMKKVPPEILNQIYKMRDAANGRPILEKE